MQALTSSFIFITLIHNILLYYSNAYHDGGESITNSKFLHSSNETQVLKPLNKIYSFQLSTFHTTMLLTLQKLHLFKRVNTKSNLLLHKMMQTFPFPPKIELKHSYHNHYGSSFYQFQQLELLICASTSIFNHFLYTTMPFISYVKIGCNFITPYFQHTQLQILALKSRKRAGYSTSCYIFIFLVGHQLGLQGTRQTFSAYKYSDVIYKQVQ